MANVIYDLGSHNGDDVAYYLKKAETVVAVEANPRLAAQIAQRFPDAIAAGRLIVEHCVLSTTPAPRDVCFYVHRTNDVLSQFPRPDESDIRNYDEIVMPARSVIDLVRTHGDPLYVKIDIEHYDHIILAELFAHGIRPPYISAEAHTVEVFSSLVTAGGYKAFNLVDGPSVATVYKSHTITTLDHRVETYSFPRHSAGPFGEDIRGRWMTADNFFKFLAFEDLGWKDIHASSRIEPDPSFVPSRLLQSYVRRTGRLRTAYALCSLLTGTY